MSFRLRIVDNALGFPVVLEEADGYPTPPPGSRVEAALHEVDVIAAAEQWLADGAGVHTSVAPEPLPSASGCGLGTFTQRSVREGEVVGYARKVILTTTLFDRSFYS